MKKISLLILLFSSFNVYSQLPKASFSLSFPGDQIVDYSRFGTFKNCGTDSSKYEMEDRAALSSAVGEGIYPNTSSIRKDSAYIQLKNEGKLNGSQWDINQSGTPQEKFYAWATASEEPGVKLYFTAEALVEAGLIRHAIKAYYALIVHYPRSACFAADRSFVWYVGPLAIDKIIGLCRKYPELELSLKNASIDIQNGEDTDLKNDKIKVNAGTLITAKSKKKEPIDLTKMEVVEHRGTGKVSLKKYKNGHWQMLVDNIPFTVKGVTYSPTNIGESPKEGSLRLWQFIDDNKNGKTDAAYESFVDKNNNNVKDKTEAVVGDFQLLKDMGCNAIRYYHVSPNNKYDGVKEFNKPLLRDLYKTYGVGVIMGDFVGAYTIGSGADWNTGTDYSDPKQCELMKSIVRDMVLDHKDEPYVLFWHLGNENNMPAGEGGVNSTATNASSKPEAYAKFLNEVAKMIHELDKNHPVAIGNQEVHLMDFYAKHAPEIDIIGVNAYRGKNGFGSLFEKNRKLFDRPIVMSEYGCDAFNSTKNEEDQDSHLDYHKGNWEDIKYNLPGGEGEGNCLGGIAFEFIDEWWKSNHGTAATHSNEIDSQMAFPDGNSSEEWFGLVGQGDGSNSPFVRQLRKAYFYYQGVWK